MIQTMNDAQHQASVLAEKAFTRTWRGGITPKWCEVPRLFMMLEEVFTVQIDGTVYRLDNDQYRLQCVLASLLAIAHDEYTVEIGDGGFLMAQPKALHPSIDHYYYNERVRRTLPPAYQEYLKGYKIYTMAKAEFYEIFNIVAKQLGVI